MEDGAERASSTTAWEFPACAGSRSPVVASHDDHGSIASPGATQTGDDIGDIRGRQRVELDRDLFGRVFGPDRNFRDLPHANGSPKSEPARAPHRACR